MSGYVKYKMVLHNKCSRRGNYCRENALRGPRWRLFPSLFTEGTKWGPMKGFPRHPYAMELTLHQRLVTEGIVSLCAWMHEARAAGQQVQDWRENGKLDSANVPLFDLLCNFQITSALRYTTEATRTEPRFHRLDQSVWAGLNCDYKIKIRNGF